MTFTQTMFSFTGRIGRLAFFCYSMLAMLAAIILVTVGLFLMNGSNVTAVMFLCSVAGALCGWCTLALTVKRLHDMEMSGWHVLWIYAALVVGSALQKTSNAGAIISAAISLALFAWLVLKAGTPDSNRFGLPRNAVLATAVVA